MSPHVHWEVCEHSLRALVGDTFRLGLGWGFLVGMIFESLLLFGLIYVLGVFGAP